MARRVLPKGLRRPAFRFLFNKCLHEQPKKTKKNKKFFFEIFFFNFKTVLTCQRWEYVLVSEIRFFFFFFFFFKKTAQHYDKIEDFLFFCIFKKIFKNIFFIFFFLN